MSSDPSIHIKKIFSKKLSIINNLNLKKIKRYNGRFVKGKSVFQFVKAFESQIGLFLIVIFSLIMNLSIASAKNLEQSAGTSPLTTMSPEAVADTALTVNSYLPVIKTDKEKITLAMATQSDSDYISTLDEFSTNLTPADPVVETPPAAQVPAKRAATINYTVQSGDTISGIAAMFGLSVATIQYSNDITNIDSLKLGQVLKIPSANLSKSALAKAQASNTKLASSSRNTVVRDSDSSSSGSYITPVSHHGISQGYSGRHRGIDYMCSVGSTVRASNGGTIVEADGLGWNYGYGKTVVINHGNGITTRYAHLSRISVSVGERVSRGEAIGLSGNTGNSTGPHLHFEKHKNGTSIYPF